MDRKQILVLIGLILVTVGIGFAIYWMFFRAPLAPLQPPANVPVNAPVTPLPVAPTGPPTAVVPPAVPSLPTPAPVSPVAQGGVTVVTPVYTNATLGATMTSSGTMSFYDRNSNKFYRMNADGSTTLLSNKEFYNVQNATFDPRGSKAIMEYPDGSNIYYDFNTGKQVTLPKHWQEFEFTAQGDKIAAKSLGTDVSNRFLVVSNPDGSGARPVQELGENADQVTVAWSPNSQVVAMASTGEPYGTDGKEVYFIGQNQENFRSMVVEGLDFRPLWSPSGGQMLYSAAASGSDYKPELWVVDASGDDIGKNRRSLNINTWADKCTFDNENTVYCAVPDDLQTGVGLQPSLADNTPDTIYKIDLNTGLQTKVAVPEGQHTIGQLMLTPDRSKLYFTDKNGGLLNKIQLK